MITQNIIKKYFPILVLLAVCACVYAPLLNNDFIIYDDQSYITANPHVKSGLTIKGIIWAFSALHVYNWHPLTWISHMLDVQLFGLNPAGHHLTSILFHAANSILLYLILKSTKCGEYKSLCVALLFALHPAHLESIAWIAERKDMLSTFFGFITILVYIKYAHMPDLRKYLLVSIFFIMGLLSKPMLVSLPIVLLLFDYWPLARWRDGGMADGEIAKWRMVSQPPGFPSTAIRGNALRLFLEKIPLFVLAAASCLVTFIVQSKEGAVNVQTPFLLNSGNAIISYVKYLFMLIWPYPLAVIYPFNPDEITLLNVSGAVIILSLFTCAALLQMQKRPYLIVGWLWYLVTLLPVAGFVRIGDHSIADRYSYIPYTGLFIIIVWAIDEARIKYRISYTKVTLASITLCTVLSIMVIKQISYWRNSFTLFEHAIEVNRENATAHKMLGLAYGALGNYEMAETEGAYARVIHYKNLVKVHPRNYELLFLLGNAYSDSEKFDEAIETYQICIALNPNLSKAYNNLGISYAKKGLLNEARQSFFKAVEIAPNNTEAIQNLKNIEAGITGQSLTKRNQ